VAARREVHELAPDPLAPRAAREFVADTCRRWQRTADLDTMLLLTSELVTNGIIHARTPLSICVTESDDMVTVEVHDSDPRPPTRRAQRADLLADIDDLIARRSDESLGDEAHARVEIGPAGAIGAGRGLYLVETLADEWGVHLTADGKSVWFRLAA